MKNKFLTTGNNHHIYIFLLIISFFYTHIKSTVINEVFFEGSKVIENTSIERITLGKRGNLKIIETKS